MAKSTGVSVLAVGIILAILGPVLLVALDPSIRADYAYDDIPPDVGLEEWLDDQGLVDGMFFTMYYNDIDSFWADQFTWQIGEENIEGGSIDAGENVIITFEVTVLYGAIGIDAVDVEKVMGDSMFRPIGIALLVVGIILVIVGLVIKSRAAKAPVLQPPMPPGGVYNQPQYGPPPSRTYYSQPPPPPPPPEMRGHACGTCGSTARYILEYNRYWCDRCGKYL